MKIVGTLNSGETSKPVEYSRTPEYRAFVFEGNGHDLVQVTVTGANRKAVIALADSTLKPIATGVGQLSAALPYHGPDTEAFYILFKGSANQPARLTVHLKKTRVRRSRPTLRANSLRFVLSGMHSGEQRGKAWILSQVVYPRIHAQGEESRRFFVICALQFLERLIGIA